MAATSLNSVADEGGRMDGGVEALHRLVTVRWDKAVAAGQGGLALRMLRIESALYFALENRGHSIRAGVASVNGEEIEFSLYEASRAEKVALTKKDWGYDAACPKWRQVLVPSRRPTLLARPLPHGGQRRWTDKGKLLEAQIPAIVRRFEIIAKDAAASRVRDAEAEQEFKIALGKAARRWEKERERRRQPAIFRALTKDWQEVGKLREFLVVLEKRLKTRAVSPALADWLEWASEYCASFDPLSEERLSELERHAVAVAYEPIDDEEPDPDEGEWRHLGMLDEYMEE